MRGARLLERALPWSLLPSSVLEKARFSRRLGSGQGSMMSWIFALLGLAMAAAGGGAMAIGWPLVPLERGWTLVIAGSALASGGLICVALAAVMGETRRTRRAIERVLEELAWSRPIERLSATTLPPDHEIVTPHPAEPGYAHAEATSPRFDKLEPQIPAMPAMPAAAPLAVAEPPSAPERQEPRLVPRTAETAVPSVSMQGEIPRGVPTSHRGPAADEPREAEKAPAELQPARSFSVGDTSFVVFTDGTIEARTPKGARRFDSMEEVRSYLEESAAS